MRKIFYLTFFFLTIFLFLISPVEAIPTPPPPTLTPTPTICVPFLSSPANGATVNQKPILYWGGCAGIPKYQVTLNSNFTSVPLSSASYNTSSYSLNLGSNTWKARSCTVYTDMTCTTYGAWSTQRNFIYQVLSPTPTPTTGPSITPSITPPGCLKSQGDANCDGRITDCDYRIWLCQYRGKNESTCRTEGTLPTNCTGSAYDADFNADNTDPTVDLIDFEIWRANNQPLNCAGNLTYSCGTGNTSATINWNLINGAASYILRFDYNYPSWAQPDDLFIRTHNPPTGVTCSSLTNCVVPITPAVLNSFYIQGTKQGEPYPESGCVVSIDETFSCGGGGGGTTAIISPVLIEVDSVNDGNQSNQ